MPCASSEHLPNIPSLSTIGNISPSVHSGHKATEISLFKKQNKKFTILLPTPRLPGTTLPEVFPFSHVQKKSGVRARQLLPQTAYLPAHRRLPQAPWPSLAPNGALTARASAPLLFTRLSGKQAGAPLLCESPPLTPAPSRLASSFLSPCPQSAPLPKCQRR